jgi:hypothetical protein
MRKNLLMDIIVAVAAAVAIGTVVTTGVVAWYHASAGLLMFTIPSAWVTYRACQIAYRQLRYEDDGTNWRS